MSHIHEAAKAFHDSLLAQFVRRESFTIASGDDRLHAYIKGPKNRWPIAAPKTYDGFPIEWHWNVGPIKAQQS